MLTSNVMVSLIFKMCLEGAVTFKMLHVQNRTIFLLSLKGHSPRFPAGANLLNFSIKNTPGGVRVHQAPGGLLPENFSWAIRDVVVGLGLVAV